MSSETALAVAAHTCSAFNVWRLSTESNATTAWYADANLHQQRRITHKTYSLTKLMCTFWLLLMSANGYLFLKEPSCPAAARASS